MGDRPHIYTLPEQFIKDLAVPIHWKLYGLINGFFINGGTAYASNEWLQEKLNCSQWSVSTAITTLEEMGLIRCEKRENKRVIFPTSSILGGSDVPLPTQRSVTTPVVGQLYHTINAVSINAVNKEEFLISSEETPRKQKSTLDGFESWWNLYPRKANKTGASAEWRKLSYEDKSAATKVNSLRKWPEPQFVLMPDRYLRDRRWEDEEIITKPNIIKI